MNAACVFEEVDEEEMEIKRHRLDYCSKQDSMSFMDNSYG